MKEILEGLSECVVLVDRDGRVLFVNSSLAERCGINGREYVGRAFGEIAEKFAGQGWRELFPLEEVFEDGRRLSFRHEVDGPVGSRKVLDVSVTPIMGENGAVGSLAAVIKDVTSGVRVEEMLEKYAEGLTVLHELSNVFLTTEGVSKTLEEALSLIGEYYGADYTQILVPSADGLRLDLIAGTGWTGDDLDKLGASAGRDNSAGYAMAEKCPAIVNDFNDEDSFVRPPVFERNGIKSSISLPMLAGEKAIGVLEILFRKPRGIETAELWYLNVVANSLAVYIEKERSLDRLGESEAYLTSVLEGIGEGVVVVDTQMRIISANKSYLDSVKMDSEDVKGRFCYEVSHHIDIPCYEKGEDCPVSEVLRTGHQKSALHTHFAKDGAPIYVQTNAYPITDPSGKVVAAVETVMDVTERVRLEKDLEKRVKELEEFYEMAVGRELKMIELKEQISDLVEEIEKHKRQ